VKHSAYPFLAIAAGLAFSLLTGSTHLHTLNFWLTAGVAFCIVTLFEILILSTLEHERMTPTQFLFRTMLVVILMQMAFACIYHFAGDEATYLSKGGARVTDFVDALYFSGVTLMTVGYGDIVPVGGFRFTAVAEVYGGMLFIFAFFSWGLGVMSDRHRRGR
jgi:potassium channel LctB